MFKRYSRIRSILARNLINSQNLYFVSSKDQTQYATLGSFKKFNLYPELLEQLEEQEIHTPTPVQNLVIPEVLNTEKNIYFCAPTGTGKTLAYLLPIMHNLKKQERQVNSILTQPNRPRVIILVPSKELVLQTKDIIKTYSHKIKLKSGVLLTEQSYVEEKQILASGIDILVSTLDRFERHRLKNNIYLSRTQEMIIDEADTFLDSGYSNIIQQYMEIFLKKEQIKQEQTNNNNSMLMQRMIFLGATYTKPLQTLFNQVYGTDQNLLKKIFDQQTHMNLSHLKHEFIHIKTLDKQQPFLNLLKEFSGHQLKTNGSTLVFCNSIASCQALEYFMKENGYECVSIHGDLPSKIRLQNFRRFKQQEVKYMISTDLGSRGLDFPFVNHVINFDFPKTSSDYLHRAGRAGRAGRKGSVNSLYHNKDLHVINELKDSYENDTPLKIGPSSFSLKNKEQIIYEKKQSEKKQIQQKMDPQIEQIKNSLVPQSYLEFKKQHEKSKEASTPKTKNYRPLKDPRKTKINTLLKQTKMKKGIRLASQKYIKGIQKNIRKIRRSIYSDKLKDSESKKSKQK